jgi:hypothetical protein
MECKENDVNDADIDDRFPADIEKVANRATLTFVNKLKITSVKSFFLLVLKILLTRIKELRPLGASPLGAPPPLGLRPGDEDVPP